MLPPGIEPGISSFSKVLVMRYTCSPLILNDLIRLKNSPLSHGSDDEFRFSRHYSYIKSIYLDVCHENSTIVLTNESVA